MQQTPKIWYDWPTPSYFEFRKLEKISDSECRIVVLNRSKNEIEILYGSFSEDECLNDPYGRKHARCTHYSGWSFYGDSEDRYPVLFIIRSPKDYDLELVIKHNVINGVTDNDDFAVSKDLSGPRDDFLRIFARSLH